MAIGGRRWRPRPLPPAALPPYPETLWPIIQGRHLRRPPAPLARGHPRPRRVDRHRHRGVVGRRAEAGDASRPGDARAGLPRGVPRYLMGVGFPADLLEGIARGVDLSTASRPRGTAGTGPRGSRPGGSMCAAPRSRDPPSRSIRSATARPAPLSRGAISGTCSWSRTYSGCAWSRSTTCGSWCGSASRPGPASWTAPSIAGGASGSSGIAERRPGEP